MNLTGSDDEICNEQLDAKGDHAISCKRGPFTNFRHDDLAEVYAEITEEIGGYARSEVFVPEFSTEAEEAWLDVWGFGVQELPDILIDVTVRHPFADRYQPMASSDAGSTARAAEKEKIARYKV